MSYKIINNQGSLLLGLYKNNTPVFFKEEFVTLYTGAGKTLFFKVGIDHVRPIVNSVERIESYIQDYQKQFNNLQNIIDACKEIGEFTITERRASTLDIFTISFDARAIGCKEINKLHGVI